MNTKNIVKFSYLSLDSILNCDLLEKTDIYKYIPTSVIKLMSAEFDNQRRMGKNKINFELYDEYGKLVEFSGVLRDNCKNATIRYRSGCEIITIRSIYHLFNDKTLTKWISLKSDEGKLYLFDNNQYRIEGNNIFKLKDESTFTPKDENTKIL